MPFIYISSMATFTLKPQSLVVSTETYSPRNLKYLPSDFLPKELAEPCSSLYDILALLLKRPVFFLSVDYKVHTMYFCEVCFICFNRAKGPQSNPARNALTETEFSIPQGEHFQNRVFWHFWDKSHNELFNWKKRVCPALYSGVKAKSQNSFLGRIVLFGSYILKTKRKTPNGKE